MLKKLLRRPRAQLLEARAMDTDYWLIRAPLAPGEDPPWAEIEELAGHLAGRMLLPDDVTPPQGSGVRSITCPAFDKQVLLDTACRIIHRTRMPMYRRLVGLIDPHAQHIDLLPRLLKYFTAVQVATAREVPYQAAAQQMMEEYGAPVLVGGADAALRDCVLILLPDGADVDFVSAFPCPVLAGGGVSPGKNEFLVTGLQLEAAKTLTCACPQGISPHRLAGALFEDGGLQFSSYVADKMFYRYKCCGIGEIVEEIGRGAGTLSLF